MAELRESSGAAWVKFSSHVTSAAKKTHHRAAIRIGLSVGSGLSSMVEELFRV